MNEENNNVFSEFGERSSKFDELLKKYQTIDEGDVVQAPPQKEKPVPVAEPVYEQPAHIEEEYPARAEPEVIEQSGFSFDIQAAEQPEEPVQKEEEPDFSYDLDMFGSSSAKSTLDIDSFDDSWLDSAFDDSLFYRADAVVPAAPEAAEPNPEPVKEEEPDREEEQTVTEPVHFVEQVPDETDKNAMAGGYIAPTDFSDFTFDPDSGMDFGAEEETASAVPEVKPQEKKKPLKEKKRTAKEKKDSGKNEMTAVTDFSKNYKASEGKGSKKDNFFVRNLIPRKSDSVAEKVRKIIMIVCVLAFLGSAGYLFNDYVIEPIRNSKQMDELEGLISDSSNVADTATLEQQYPGIDFPEGMLEKYAALYARNQDFVGWITIDGLDISLPVVRGENNEKYLKTDFDGKYSKYGSIFMNCSNRIDKLNYNTSLFGHYMYDSKMFGNLIQYKSASGYKKAPLIEFNTLYGDYKWKVFAVFITNGTKEGDDGYLFNYMFTDLSTSENVENFLGEIKQRSLYYPKVDIAVSDKILTLSTCTYEFEEARLVIMARMVRPGESEAVDTSVRYNSNPRYPAAYYKENSLSNPYDSAYRWYPS